MPKHATKIHITKFLRMTVRLQVKVCGRGLGQLPIGCTSALSDTKAQLQLQLRPLALNKCYMYIAFLFANDPWQKLVTSLWFHPFIRVRFFAAPSIHYS